MLERVCRKAEDNPITKRPPPIAINLNSSGKKPIGKSYEGPMNSNDADRAIYETRIVLRDFLSMHELIQLPSVKPVPQTAK